MQQCGIFRKTMFDLPTREQGKRQEVTRSEVRELRKTQGSNHLVRMLRILAYRKYFI